MEGDESTGSIIRESIARQVTDCQWLEELKNKYDEIGQAAPNAVVGARCIICSLPVGTCKHNTGWLDKMAPWNKDLLADQSIDENMDDVLDVLGAGSVIAATPAIPQFNFNNMRWCRHIPRIADVIGAEKVQISFPGCRGFHTAVTVGEVVVIFGGLQYQKTRIPQPFTSSIRPGDVTCLGNIYIYHIVNTSWHVVHSKNQPEPRYGHVCAALDNDTMIMYGGRGQGGKILSDTWFFTVSTSTWNKLEIEKLCPPPQARMFSAMCSLNNYSVLLFGGTDGSQNYGDTWIFRGHEWRWERGITAGCPPQPRYGHTMCVVKTSPQESTPINIDTNSFSKSFRANDNIEVVVMGGCIVNPVSEISGASEGPLGTSIESQAQAKRLAHLNKSLQDAYAMEGISAVLSGQMLASTIEIGSICSSREGTSTAVDLKLVYQEAARSAARISALENETRDLESKLMQSWHESQSMQDYNKRTAKHPMKSLDTHILSIGDMVWMQQKKKSITGEKPCSRMLSTAATLGDRYILLTGGVLPTALGYRPVDKEHTTLFVFDSQRLTWSRCIPMASKESMNEPLHMAQMEIARAKQRVDLEHRRGMMLGAPGGLTAELIEARRLAKVSEWRKEMLLAELDSMIAPPPPRWGATGVQIGSRILLYGGWTDKQAAMENDTFLLDAEDDMERNRRIEDEFQARIEIERMENESRGRGNDLQSAFELRMILAAEREREENERRIMGVCDILSRLPELTRPNPVRFVKSNEHTIWVEWDPVLKDAYGKPVNDIEYLLIMSGGYVPLGKNDRVEVKPSQEYMKKYRENMAIVAENQRMAKKKKGFAGLNAALKEAEMNEKGKRKKKIEPIIEDVPFFRGEIAHAHPDGSFDIRYDDGSLETRVKRERLNLEYDHPDPSTLSGKAAERLRESLKKKEALKVKESIKTALSNTTKAMAFGDFDHVEESSASISGMNKSPKPVSTGRSSYLDDVFDILPVRALNDKQLESPQRRVIVLDDDDTKATTGLVDDITNENCSTRNFNRTIKTDLPKSYRIIYRGPNLKHICEGIVPLEVVNNEPDFVCSVSIALITIGTDYPDNALSQMSYPVTCSTRRTRIWDTVEDSGSTMSGMTAGDDSSVNSLNNGLLEGSPGLQHNQNFDRFSPEKKTPVVLSKKKKDIITAVLKGNQMIEIEREKSAILSAGIFDHFV